MTTRHRFRKMAAGRVMLCALLIALGLVAVLPLEKHAAASAASIQRISKDTTWTEEGSPYVLRGRVVVEEGVTLTVEPGVKVLGTETAALVVRGLLLAEGSPSERIVFSRKIGHPHWKGIVIVGDRSLRSAGKHSRISFARIQRARVGLRSLYDSPTVKSSVFRTNRLALKVTAPNSDVLIAGNVFLRNRRAIVGRARSVIEVRRNDFWDNNRNIIAGPRPTYSCGLDAGGWEIHANDILRGPRSRWYSNDVRTTPGSNVSKYYVDARNNWWGTSDERDIAARILDGYDDFRFKKVDASSPSGHPHTAWAPPGRVGAPDPEPTTHGDAFTRSYINSPHHGQCIKRGEFRKLEGRAQGHLGELRYVDAALRRQRSRGCAWWSDTRERMVRGKCSEPLWFRAEGAADWSYHFNTVLPKGRYAALSRSNGEGAVAIGRNKIRFRLTR